MTPQDIERRISALEKRLLEIDRQLAVLATGVALARWLGPFAVSVVAIVIVVLK